VAKVPVNCRKKAVFAAPVRFGQRTGLMLIISAKCDPCHGIALKSPLKEAVFVIFKVVY
jgi:hypothetical protein